MCKTDERAKFRKYFILTKAKGKHNRIKRNSTKRVKAVIIF